MAFQRILYKLQSLQNNALRLCLCKDSRYNVNLLHSESKIPVLKHKQQTQLLNFVYPRSSEDIYIKTSNRSLRLYVAPVMIEIKSNNASFERSILYEGARKQNLLSADERNIQDHSSFKYKQKQK